MHSLDSLDLANTSKQDFANFNRRYMSVAWIELARSRREPKITSLILDRCRLTKLLSPASKVMIAPAKTVESDCMRLILQLTGQTSIENARFSAELTQGDFLLYDPNHACHFVSPGQTEQLLLHIPRDCIAPYLIGQFASPLLLSTPGDGLAAVCAAHICSIFQQREILSPACKGRLEVSLLNLIRELLVSAPDASCRRGSLDTLHARIAAYVERNLDKPLNVSVIAARMGCSARYVHRAFDERGTTPRRFIWELRLDRAYQKLSANPGRVPVSSIASSLGFQSYSHFTRAFKSKFGLSPSEIQHPSVALKRNAA